MVVVLIFVAVLGWLAGMAFAFDWLARRRHWKLGGWTQRLTRTRAWRIDTRWGPTVVHGGCEKCGTSWRYVDPHPIAINPYGRLAVIFPFCENCHTKTPRLQRGELYLSWWLDRRDRMLEEGDVVPDVREWEDIKTALGIEQSPNRVVA